jgi:DNA-directed RNA polymerase specialized sigma24 family protein
MNQEPFDRFLAWLHPDRDQAGGRYEVIRRGLIQFFARRGCFDAEDLADQTIERVCAKLPEIADGYTGEQAKYCYRVAHFIHLEYLRRPHPVPPACNPKDSFLLEQKERCRHRCLEKLSADEKDLILRYYQPAPAEGKAEHRRQLAEQYQLSGNALTVRAYRIRSALYHCLEDCLQEMPVSDVITA